MMKHLLLAGLGGLTGTMLRFLCYQLPIKIPHVWITCAINIAGSLIMGMAIGYISKQSSSESWKIFLTTGICGGLTTFSAFSMENVQLIQTGKYNLALTYITTSVILSIGAAFAGIKITS